MDPPHRERFRSRKQTRQRNSPRHKSYCYRACGLQLSPRITTTTTHPEKAGTIAGTAHTQEYLLLHLAMFPIGLNTWCHVLGVPDTHQLQAQIIIALGRCWSAAPLPSAQKPPWPGYVQSMRLFTKLLVAHPLVEFVCPLIPPCRIFESSRIHGGLAIS